MEPHHMDLGNVDGADAPQPDVFRKGQTVYGQDGEEYEFAHVCGEWAYVYPMMLIQCTSYRGDDFSEESVAADHLVRRKVTSLSGRPWTQKIEAESARLFAERKATLDDLNKQIGAAQTALTRGQRDLEDFERTRQVDIRVLERKYAWVREARRLMGDETFFVLNKGSDIPREVANQRHLTLKMDAEGQYRFVIEYDEGDDEVEIFSSDIAMRAAVTKLFEERAPEVSDQRKWIRAWPHLEEFASEAYRICEAAAMQEKVDAARERAATLMAEAEDLTRQANEGKITSHIPKHRRY